MSTGIDRQNTITRKNLVYSLITGLIIGAIAGAPLGWVAHRFFAEQRLYQVGLNAHSIIERAI